MISVIISSANKTLLENVLLNIESTIGVPYEVISVDNSAGLKGICEIYNDGAEMAKYEVLCFMHEDLDIKTNNWGKYVASQFETFKDLGIIGVVGSGYKSFVPSGWGVQTSDEDLVFGNYIQTYKHAEKKCEHIIYGRSKAPELNKVICVDGMWFCSLKSIVLKYPFDSEMLKGFHCYDIDFCLSVSRYFDVSVTFEVLMEHFSEGSYSRPWLEDTLKVQNKWESTLPRMVRQLPQLEINQIEKRGYKWILERYVELGYSFIEIMKFLEMYKTKGAIDFKIYWKLKYYAIRYFYKRKKSFPKEV